MATTFDDLTIGAADRKSDAVRAELWRRVNAVGNWVVSLRNTGGKFNNTFRVQNPFIIDVNTVRLMQGFVDSPGVSLIGQDGEDIWDEWALIGGFDRAQDLLFHDDFEAFYPNTAQFIHQVLNDVFNVQLLGLTNITYAPPLVSPVVGAVEFKEGTSFLSTLQEMFRNVDWVFYVDDNFALQAGALGFSASGVILNSVAGGPNNTIIGVVDFKERDGDKLYNYIKLYGKNPMFDAWTELTVNWQGAAAWTFVPVGQGLDDTNLIRVGTYSQVCFNNNPANSFLSHQLILPKFNYASFDLSKGEIGIWARYDNDAGAPGTPGAGGSPANMRVECRLIDGTGQIADYYGESTRIYLGDWGWCTFPLGEKYETGIAGIADQWNQLLGPDFNWRDVRELHFNLPRLTLAGNRPSHFYIDGITLPLPPISITENVAGSQAIFRRRPFIDQRPDIRTQHALDEKANYLLTHHEGDAINEIKLTSQGNTALRYAGQSVTINIPQLGINNAIYNMTQIHHIIEPYTDVTGAYGFDYITEIEAVPVSGVAFDHGRLKSGSVYSPTQRARRDGTGIRLK